MPKRTRTGGINLSGLKRYTPLDTRLHLARDFMKDPAWQSVKDEPDECVRLNLIYHICPLLGTYVWRANIQQLTRRWSMFTGRKVVAVSTGLGMASLKQVQREFGDLDCEFIEVPNDIELREAASFPQLMSAVESTDPCEATFYAHAKGVSTGGDSRGVTYWRNGMYHTLLDQGAVKLLNRYPFVGTHLTRTRTVMPDKRSEAPWHFAGTFWWFRNRDIFSRDWRSLIPEGGWGIEALPAAFYPKPSSVACVWMDNPVSPYEPDSYKLRLSNSISNPGTPDVRIEIGGGRSPRMPGYTNFDVLDDPLVDVQFDFDSLTEGGRLPYADDTVEAVYSSHCFEHLRSDTLKAMLHEIVRVLPLGGTFTLVQPHWNHNAAMIDGHHRTIGEDQVKHWVSTAIPYWWGGSPKRLRLTATKYMPSEYLAEARPLFPNLDDQQLMRFIPNTCHEVAFTFSVVSNGA